MIGGSHSLVVDAFEFFSSALTAYDGLYVALAEQLEAALVTADVELARAVRARRLEVVMRSEC